MRDEINNIALRIVKIREAKNNMRYNPDTGLLEGDWKPKAVETLERKHNEANRFFKLPDARQHGLKYVPPPVIENI